MTAASCLAYIDVMRENVEKMEVSKEPRLARQFSPMMMIFIRCGECIGVIYSYLCMSTAADGKWKDPFREELSAWWKVLWDIGMFFRGLFCWCVGM